LIGARLQGRRLSRVELTDSRLEADSLAKALRRLGDLLLDRTAAVVIEPEQTSRIDEIHIGFSS
jgi:hypothetical protein